VRKPYLYFVDFGLDNRKRRGWVLNMDALAREEGPFAVAHGGGSSEVRNAVPGRFSNVPGSNATSLGLYLAAETYDFNGKSGSAQYKSIGLRMDGKSGRFNDKARSRGVVVHGAPYVTDGDAGRSDGCPAMELARAKRLIPLLAKGGVVFHFSPNDQEWMGADPWVNAG
ncbi:MAG TPA: murein L,D-transpeptidase catalytic domain family protein, partial [Longimicrobium sp.]|nr:murein L,D-transpeptidase catalytic domain family protein [Longimicrobium sp.]